MTRHGRETLAEVVLHLAKNLEQSCLGNIFGQVPHVQRSRVVRGDLRPSITNRRGT